MGNKRFLFGLLLILLSQRALTQKANASPISTEKDELIGTYSDPPSKLYRVSPTTINSQHAILYFEEGGLLELIRTQYFVQFISKDIPESLKNKIVKVKASHDKNPDNSIDLREFILGEGSSFILTTTGPYIFFIVQGANGSFNIK